MISVETCSSNPFHSLEPNSHGSDFSNQSRAYTMLPDSAHFQKSARTQPPINPSLHLHRHSHPSPKQILSSYSVSTVPFPSPPEHNVPQRTSPQSHSSSRLPSPPQRSAFTPFKPPNAFQDVRDIHPSRSHQSSIHINGLLTPTNYSLRHYTPSLFSPEHDSILPSRLIDTPPSHKTFKPKILSPQVLKPTTSLSREEMEQSNEPKVMSEPFYPSCSTQLTLSNTSSPIPEVKSVLNHAYDPIRDSWTPYDMNRHLSKETEPPTSKAKLVEQISPASPQPTCPYKTQVDEAVPRKRPEKTSSVSSDVSGFNSIPPALPSSPPLSPIAATKKRQRSLSSDPDLYENPSKSKRKVYHEETRDNSFIEQSTTNSHQERGGLLDLSELCNDSAGTESIDFDYIQDYYKQCESPAPSEMPNNVSNDDTSSTPNEKGPKSLGQISSMVEEKPLEGSLVEQEFEEERIFDVDETIESIESFLTQDVDIFGAISAEDPTTSSWSVTSNRRKPISSLLLSDTSDNE